MRGSKEIKKNIQELYNYESKFYKGIPNPLVLDLGAATRDAVMFRKALEWVLEEE